MHFYPDSTYARSLGDDLRARATERVFHPPATGARVRCAHCGAANAATPGIDELVGFICSHWGRSVKVEPPKVQ